VLALCIGPELADRLRNGAVDEGTIEFNPMIGKKLKQAKVEIRSTSNKADPFS